MERAALRRFLIALQVSMLWLPARPQQCGKALPKGQFADPSVVKSVLKEDCWDDIYLHAQHGKLPRSIQAGLPGLMQLLHPDDIVKDEDKVERGCISAAVPWPRRWNLYLVPFETIVHKTHSEVTMDEETRKLGLALLRVSADGSCWSVLAKTVAPLPRKPGLRLDHFDFAAYRLNENEIAFGLRSYFYSMYIGGDGHDEILELFRVKDGTIEPILWTLTSSSNLVKGEQRGDPKSAVMRVLPTKTNGVFDLKKSVRGGGSAIFRWNGHAYESHDPEPVECSNEPCEDIEAGRGER